MTARAQRLIDENFGLDFYLLKTPVNEIYSWLGLKVSRLSQYYFLAQDLSNKVNVEYFKIIQVILLSR